MRLAKKAGRGVVFLLLSLFLIEAIGPAEVLGQTGQPLSSEQPSSQEPSSQATSPAEIQAVIDRAEAGYRRGAEASARGEAEVARKHFDEAIDAILLSGIDIRTHTRLDAYYRDLIERIRKQEAAPLARPPLARPDDRQQSAEERAEEVESAVIDELAGVNESELATVTAGGIKIFGKYDFDFSVAAPVFQYINYFVAGRGRSTMEVGLKRSGRYRQMAERIFKEERVPLDLIWLAQAESVWKPNALSHAAAKGIWQFIPGTGQRYGLAQTAWVDERSHPEKSTRAAARYLRWLHDYFAGDWLLAMAAYNSGEHRVSAKIAQCGYADFWEIHRRAMLPTETRNYVPIILSIIIISKNQKRYGFDVQPDPPLIYDTFDLPDQTDLKVVADLLGVPYESIRDLNPELRRGASPPDRAYSVKLPKGTRKQFEIAYANLPEDQRIRKVVIPAADIAERARPQYRTQVVSYKVKRGDTLAGLARRHGLSVQELAKLNHMSSRGELRKGQSVRIPMSVRAGRSRGSKVSKKLARYNERKASRSRYSKRDARRAAPSKRVTSKSVRSKSVRSKKVTSKRAASRRR
jgi:membrane-bound lytic murein transglycosylase D